MKKLGILVAIGIIVSGGYTGLWFYNAGNMKKEAESAMQSVIRCQ